MGEEDGRGRWERKPPGTTLSVCSPNPGEAQYSQGSFRFECGARVSDGRIAPLEVQGEVSRHCIDLPGDHEMGKEPRKLHLDL